MKPKRRILSGKITHVSICRRGMNLQPVLVKSGNRLQIDLLTKTAPEGLVYALVYVPEESGAVDGEGDVAPAAVIKQIAHDFLANGGNVDFEHDLQPLGTDRIQIAETFLVQKGDPRFADWKDYHGRPVDPTGSWALVLKVLDPQLRKDFEEGRINGVSMFGNATVEQLNKNTPNTNTSNTMTPEQMQALCEMLTKSLSAVLRPSTPTTPDAPKPAPIEFEGDPLNAEDLAKHMDKVLFANLDLSKPSDLAKWQGHVAKRQAEIAKRLETPADPVAKAQAELARAQAELARLQKASGAPDTTPPANAPAQDTGLSKAEQDGFALGKSIMQKFQKRK